MEPHSKHFFVTQSGLVGEGMPIHRSPYVAEAKSYSLQPGKDVVEVRLKAREAGGTDVVKRYRFHRAATRSMSRTRSRTTATR
jgi:YidC/Oxa1 family membrane protein insertase